MCIYTHSCVCMCICMSSASEIPTYDGNIITQSGIFSLTPCQPPGEENNNVIKRFVSLARKKRYRVNIYI